MWHFYSNWLASSAFHQNIRGSSRFATGPYENHKQTKRHVKIAVHSVAIFRRHTSWPLFIWWNWQLICQALASPLSLSLQRNWNILRDTIWILLYPIDFEMAHFMQCSNSSFHLRWIIPYRMITKGGGITLNANGSTNKTLQLVFIKGMPIINSNLLISILDATRAN